MGSTVKSIRVEEELWDSLHRLSKEEDRPLTQLLNEALERYLAEKSGRKAAEKARNLPALSLGGEPVTREEIYEDRC
jgi:predicted DNA-binding protein